MTETVGERRVREEGREGREGGVAQREMEGWHRRPKTRKEVTYFKGLRKTAPVQRGHRREQALPRLHISFGSITPLPWAVASPVCPN